MPKYIVTKLVGPFEEFLVIHGSEDTIRHLCERECERGDEIVRREDFFIHSHTIDESPEEKLQQIYEWMDLLVNKDTPVMVRSMKTIYKELGDYLRRHRAREELLRRNAPVRK